MAGKDLRIKREPQHRILREIYRHYMEFRELVSRTGESVFEHGLFIYDEDGNVVDKQVVQISFWDLHKQLAKLSDRKREAVFYNVILDKKQKDVAEIMEITTVSVGQYVEQAMLQLAPRYFAEQTSEGEEANADGVKLHRSKYRPPRRRDAGAPKPIRPNVGPVSQNLNKVRNG